MIVEVDDEVLLMLMAKVVVVPREVILCSVPVFQTTTDPVEVDTAVSVPADRV